MNNNPAAFLQGVMCYHFTNIHPKSETMFTLPCIIFAGGKSSRMGRDKSLLPFGGYPTLVEYQFARLSGLFRRVYISAKSADKFDFEAPVIADPDGCAAYAPTAGFAALFDALDDERVFVISVDSPFVGTHQIEALLAADSEELDAVIARTPSGSHPMCGIYHRTLAPAFAAMLQNDDHRLGKLLKSSRTRYVDFDDEHPFTNLNHPEEYDAAFKHHASGDTL